MMRPCSCGGRRPGVLDLVIEQRDAEIAMLRGEGCLVDGDGPCGCCVKCLRLRAEAAERAIQEKDTEIARLNRSMDEQIESWAKRCRENLHAAVGFQDRAFSAIEALREVQCRCFWARDPRTERVICGRCSALAFLESAKDPQG